MIGHYLLTLSEAQEDRLLTLTFEPLAHLGAGHCSRCMVLVAMDRTFGQAATGLTHDENYDTRRDALSISPGWRYEYACDRFGVERVNNAIRARILTNRLWRTLENRPVSVRAIVRETVVAGGTSGDLEPRPQ